MLNITLKGGVIRQCEEGITVAQLAKSIGMGLYKSACAAKINGNVVDLRTVLTEDAQVQILTFEDDEGKKAFRHTASHILAQAVKRLYPNTKMAIGPAIENGFYYDFDVRTPFTEDDLKKIESEMKSIVKEDLVLERVEVSPEEATALMEKLGETYKIELIAEHAGGGDAITLYKQGEFTDLCAGPHLMSTGMVKAVKLIQTTGAYWRGDAAGKQLARIYGTAFPKAAELETYLAEVEEAKKRDHNLIGRQLNFFTTSDIIGQGLPLLMPKGAKVIQILQRFVEDEEEKRGYLLTKTPMVAKSDLYKTSGHWDHYHDSMFILGDEEKDDEVFALRPMTCPFQFTIYNSALHSYRDLPIRYSETSTLFRNESSGEMHGLIRVRQFTISEGHLVVLPEQLAAEFAGVVDLIKYMMSTLGIEDDISYRFSKWDENNREKYIGDTAQWNEAQSKMKQILLELDIPHTEAEGEAAFYGPKLDIQMKNVHGKEDTIITVQIDFALAERFGMVYVDADGQKKHPFVIHRTSIGCYERTLAMLIEKYAGALPLWLCPEQVRILPISAHQHAGAREMEQKILAAGIRVKTDDRNEKIGYKIREAQMEKIPYMLVVGDKELENGAVSVRSRSEGDQGSMPLDEFVKMAAAKIGTKAIR